MIIMYVHVDESTLHFKIEDFPAHEKETAKTIN